MNPRTPQRAVAAGVLGLITLVSVGVATPRTAYAWDITWDLPNSVFQIGTFVKNTAELVISGDMFAKEYILDSIAWIGKELVLQSMSQSLMNWASNGFEGSPAFVTDLQNNLLRVGDTAALRFVAQMQNDGRIDSPFRTQSVGSARDSYFRATGGLGASNPYTLRSRCQDDAGFLSGNYFNLDCWGAAWQNPANNPYGGQILATDALLQNVGTAQSTRQEELRYSGGFLSWRSCEEEPNAADGSVNLSQLDNTLGCAIQIPGALGAHAINKTFVDLGIDVQVNADELNEVIGSFISRMLQDVLSDGIENTADAYSRPNAQQSVNSANLTGSFLQVIANQKARLEEVRGGWQRIYDIAIAAKTKLETCNSNGARATITSDVQPVINEATFELTRTTAALATLNNLQTRVNTPADPNNTFDRISSDYQAFVSSGALPSATSTTRAIQESQDIPPPGPTTIYRKMSDIIGAQCRTFRNSTDTGTDDD